MGFNRENYAKIKQEYEGKYLRAQEDAQFRRAEVHAKVPEVCEIDKQLALTGLEVFKATVSCDAEALDAISKKNRELMERRAQLLESHGYERNYTEIRYECSECGDTGVVDNRMCRCMKKKLIEAGFESSGMGDLIKRQSFDNFSLDFYKNSDTDHRRMSTIYKVLKQYAESFDAEKSENVAMFGGTGLAKLIFQALSRAQS